MPQLLPQVSFFPYVASLVAVADLEHDLQPLDGPGQPDIAGPRRGGLHRAAGKDTAMLTVILFGVSKNMGYYMVIYLAGLQGTNPELEEAAELDGANKWQIFWNVTVPQLKPTTFFVIIMLTIASFKVYDQMYMITQGGPGNATMTLVYYIYNVAFVTHPSTAMQAPSRWCCLYWCCLSPSFSSRARPTTTKERRIHHGYYRCKRKDRLDESAALSAAC